MRGNLKQAWLWMLPVAFLGACGGAPEAALEDGTLEEGTQALISAPTLPASGNIADSTTLKGPLAIGGAVAGYPSTLPGYFGYTLQANAGAQLALEVTHLGSSMYLDTGLFLYGPKDASGSHGATLHAQDDDSGYGTLSKVGLVTVPKTGEYLVVVGFVNGVDKQFRLQAACVGGTCLPNPQPAPAGAVLRYVENPLTERLQYTLDTANQVREDATSYLRRLDYQWPYSGEATLTQAAAAVLAQGRYIGYRSDPAPLVLSLPELNDAMYSQFRPLLPVMLETYGNGVETVQVKRYYRTFSTGPNGDNWRSLYVILFPQSYKVLVYEQTAHEI
ncbi:hypothetical protein HUA78_44080 [Myxococcus sp. CA033]|uniref:hypothetical protein n=1 Tax=Myxococcus sp. CA033 TaxID=2741516 RepID=UPI00157A29B9|nr:hypothetical protein [Myxococcus sp. CA033]NTX41430.1 hypothetical protein [Myxococcus sp. CA033]